MKYLVAFIIPVILMYLTGSFIEWTFNPGVWAQEARVCIVGFAFILALPAMGVAHECDY